MRNMRKFYITFVSIMAIAIILPSFTAFASFKPPDEPNSEALYMVNIGSDFDTPILEINKDEKRQPASLVKIMTAILLLEHSEEIGKPLEDITVTVESFLFDDFYDSNGYYIYPSTADFQSGEVVDMKDVIYGLLLNSACEAANIIANYVGEGDISSFVDMMNAKAKEIGAVNTNFMNPHGLHDDNQYSTAYDIYLITKYAMDLPGFMEIATTARYELKATNKHSEPRMALHTNLMLDKQRGGPGVYYEHVKGIKTGTLDAAGRCLVSTGSKDGYNYLIVTMGAPIYDKDGNKLAVNLSYTDHRKFYEWAFNTFRQTKIVTQNEDIMSFPVEQSAGNDYVNCRPEVDFSTLLPSTLDKSSVQIIKPPADPITAPITKGDVLGSIELRLNDETLTVINLIAAEDVERSELAFYLDKAKDIIASPIFKLVVILIAILLFAYLIMFIKINKKKKASKRIRRNRRF